MTDHNPPPTPPADPAPKPAAAKQASKTKIGDLVQTAKGRYALVVGFEKVRHTHQDSNGAETDRIEREHPLVIDIPGTARRHEIETLPL